MPTATRPLLSSLRTGAHVIVDADPRWVGRVEYVTASGWVGVRQGVRLDEVQASRVEVRS